MKKELFFCFLIVLLISFVSAKEISMCSKFTNINNFSEIVLIGFPQGDGPNAYVPYKINQDECLEQGNESNTLHIYWTSKKHFDEVGIENIQPLYDDDIYFLTDDIDAADWNAPNGTDLDEEKYFYELIGFKEQEGKEEPRLYFYKKRRIQYFGDDTDYEKNFTKPTISDLSFNFSEFIETPGQNISINKTNLTEQNITDTGMNQTQNTSKINHTNSNSSGFIIEQKQDKKSLFERIGCFFSWIFGGEC
jgi:hypothetical protein